MDSEQQTTTKTFQDTKSQTKRKVILHNEVQTDIKEFFQVGSQTFIQQYDSQCQALPQVKNKRIQAYIQEPRETLNQGTQMSKICVDEGTQNVTKAKPKSTQIPDEPVYTEFMIDNDADEVMNEYSDSDEDYRENLYAAGNPRNWLKDKMFIPNDFQIDCKKEVISAMKYFL